MRAELPDRPPSWPLYTAVNLLATKNTAAARTLIPFAAIIEWGVSLTSPAYLATKSVFLLPINLFGAPLSACCTVRDTIANSEDAVAFTALIAYRLAMNTLVRLPYRIVSSLQNPQEAGGIPYPSVNRIQRDNNSRPLYRERYFFFAMTNDTVNGVAMPLIQALGHLKQVKRRDPLDMTLNRIEQSFTCLIRALFRTLTASFTLLPYQSAVLLYDTDHIEPFYRT